MAVRNFTRRSMSVLAAKGGQKTMHTADFPLAMGLGPNTESVAAYDS
jgi:hypothetical protein